jgi:hypothetical protein
MHLEERRTSLQRKLMRLRELQAHFMPGLATHQPLLPTRTCLPEDVPLFLPSSFPADTHSSICSLALSEPEMQLRIAQTSDSLSALRYHLRIHNYTHRFKVKHITGQGPTTQAREVLENISNKIQSSATKYRRAREAYL